MLPQLAAYVPQTDKHFPVLSVQESLSSRTPVALRRWLRSVGRICCRTARRADEAAVRKTEALNKNYPDVIIEQLGVKICRDMEIGDAWQRDLYVVA
ncbi:hypothetical protein V7S43_005689 [Phytophthora oleae]|uniref:Uncharacterized protein n=1 Tax=Phytophthora oleae TaxID=2107226 RepID=A0ABD3FSG4_9STRA